ncbi:hypothetical protein ACWD4G_41610 [Streptomyces sp. NPDC002643]
MSDAYTTQPPTADPRVAMAEGHGKHRGEGSVQETPEVAETTPRGRHRKPAVAPAEATNAA